jgi:hypothetical protein
VVRIEIPAGYAPERVPVRGGEFSSSGSMRGLRAGEEYEFVVRGEQSGRTLSQSFKPALPT